MGRTSLRLITRNCPAPEFIWLNLWYYRVLGGCILVKKGDHLSISYARWVFQAIFDATAVFGMSEVLIEIWSGKIGVPQLFRSTVIVMTVLFSFVNYFQQVIYRKRIFNLMKRLEYMEELLSGLCVTTSHRGLLDYSLMFVLVNVLCVVDLILDLKNFSYRNLCSVLWCFTSTQRIQASVFTQVTVLYVVFVQQLHIQKCLQWMRKSTCKDWEKIVSLCEAQNEILNICEDIADIFGMANGAVVVISLSLMVYQPYTLMHRIPRHHQLLILSALTWLLYGVVNLCTIATYCQRISDQGHKFNNLLFDVVLEDETCFLSTNEQVEVMLTMKRTVCFTVYDTFYIDHQLIFAVVGAVVTYLVFFFQFGGS